ncbi:flagellin [Deltaproteobacteria bacterium TL4]
MRITEITKRDNVLGNVQKNAQHLKDLQTELSSGKRINKTSDDPVGATIVQDIVTTVTRKEQLQSNLKQNLEWLERNEVELQHMADLLSKTKQLILAQSGSSATPESRTVTAQELVDIRNAIIQAGNAKTGKLYLFSGTKTLTEPLQHSGPIQPAKVSTDGVVQKDVAELLDVEQFRAQFEGYSLNSYRIRITQTGVLGFARYQISDNDGQTWSKEQILNPRIKVWNSEGAPNDQVVLRFSDEQGLLGSIIPDQFDFTQSNVAVFDFKDNAVIFPEGMEFVFLPKSPIVYEGNAQKREVLIANGIKIPLNITAQDIFFKGEDSESVDIFQLYQALENGLKNNDERALSARVEDLDRALNQVLKQQAQVGNNMIQLEKSGTKLDEQIFSTQKRLSEAQDVDLSKSIIELNTAERNNQVSLDSGGRLLQPSLLQFLR